MSNKSLTRSQRSNEMLPSIFDDFFRSWNERLGIGSSSSGLMGRTMTVPAVNVTENENDYMVWVAAPGLKKNDFDIDLEGNMLTISCEKEETMEDERHTRREYNYTQFSRSFTLPEEVIKDKIEATYEDGVLKITLPKTEQAKKAPTSKHISVK